MKIIEHVKPYSWLQWPLRLKNCNESVHITAKYFGKADIDPWAIDRRMRGNFFLPHDQFEWRPELFSDIIPVLELVRVPAALLSVHHSFDVIRNDFFPYRPHITVPKEYWAWVNLNKIKIQEELILIGEPELHYGRVRQ